MQFVVPPFKLGQTYKGKDDDGNLINPHWLGQVHEHPYNNQSGSQVRGNRKRQTGRQVVAVPLRNETGETIYGKHLARLTFTAGFYILESVERYSHTLAERGVVIIDPFLKDTGCADDDIFWGVIGGPAVILTPSDGTQFAGGDIAVGQYLVGATAAGTTAGSSGGRVTNVSLASATDAQGAFNQAANLVGVAMSARSTGETNSELLINAMIRL